MKLTPAAPGRTHALIPAHTPYAQVFSKKNAEKRIAEPHAARVESDYAAKPNGHKKFFQKKHGRIESGERARVALTPFAHTLFSEKKHDEGVWVKGVGMVAPLPF